MTAHTPFMPSPWSFLFGRSSISRAELVFQVKAGPRLSAGEKTVYHGTMDALQNPDVTWSNDGTPRSGRFGDVYYSVSGGLAETKHVFLNGAGLPEAWRGRNNFVVGETGFGTGLNFLATWRLWRDTADPAQRLHFVSVEGFPLAPDDLVRVHKANTELTELAEWLAAQYPRRHPGYHYREFDGGRVSLLLLFGSIEDALGSLSACVDAWFLDGFAPKKNPDMWTGNVFRLIASRSAEGARLATFTAAGGVRRGLEEVGFVMEKRPGYGSKRQCLTGRFAGRSSDIDDAPWYRIPEPVTAGSRIAVIGAGIAGAAAARALSDAGCMVQVFEQGSAPDPAASGNPLGLLQPRAGSLENPYGRFQAAAYLHALETYERLEVAGVWHGDRGLLSVGRDEDDLARQIEWSVKGGLPSGDAEPLSAADASELAGLRIRLDAVHYPRAGTIRPQAVCQALLSGISCRWSTAVGAVEPDSGGWRLRSANGEVIWVGKAVVLANGTYAAGLCPDLRGAIHANRGQITYVSAGDRSLGLRLPVAFGGYVTPVYNGGERLFHVLGATYDRAGFSDDRPGSPQPDDDVSNRERLTERLPDLADALDGEILGGRVGFRATTADHLPLVGPVPEKASFVDAFADLRHGSAGRRFGPAPYRPGLFVLSGLGSRGFSTAPVAAQVLRALLLGEPLPVPRDVYHALHPARFLVRDLKRR